MNRVLPLAAASLAAGWFAHADTVPVDGLVNYETPHVHPLDLTPDGRTLLAVNTAAHRLEIFDVTSGTPVPKAGVQVGLDPVSVRARSNAEAWVVNQLSDSVSVVSLERLTVTATLQTENEPADVVFAGSPARAFVSCSDANSLNVFDPANPAAAPVKLALAGEEPRALAVSPDGKRVYCAIFESGNGTTVLNGRPGDSVNVVSRSDSPYAGKNPPPNSGSNFVPAINPAAGTPPQVSLIVRKDDAGKWLDDNSRDWSPFVSGALSTLSKRVAGWDLPDHDVAVIDAATLAVSYQNRLMNLCMALGVNPATGAVSVVGTDAINHVRWEPNLNGRFLRVQHATFQPGGAATVRDLNPHLDYSQATAPDAVRAQSLGDPRGIAWTPDGSLAFVTGMGSNNVAVVAANGSRVTQFDVGQGPTGIVLNGAANRGFVMNKFSGSISVLDLAGRRELSRVAFDDPTPAAIKAGRPMLYDTRKTSGLGHVSCASCHVDGKTDRLAWDLGDPRGTPTSVPLASNVNGAPTGGRMNVSAMKGPMVTQTLQDIMKHPSLHWRGDRGTLADFSGAYVSLMGAATAPTAAEMSAFGALLGTVHLPPNPYRNLDDSRPSAITLPDGSTVASSTMNALRGANSKSNNCLQCHLNGGTRNRASNSELGQAFVAPALSLYYKKLGFWPGSAAGSTTGTGFFHDGADTLSRAARVDSTEAMPDMLAEIMTLEGPTGPLTGGEKRQDTHAGVGRQVTVNGTATAAQSALLNQLVTIANASPHAALVARGRLAGLERGFFLASGTTFQSDRTGESRTLAQLLATAASEPVTFTLVAQGTERRLGIDRDNDGVPDADAFFAQPPPAAGLSAQYFAGRNLAQLVATRTDAALDFLWPDTQAPLAGMPGDDFSVRWTGRLQPQFSETYRFHLNCDDGVRLWVNGQLLLDHWDREPATYFDLVSAPIALTAGQYYDLRVEFQDVYSDAWLQLMWESPSQPVALVPAGRLFQPAASTGNARSEAVAALPAISRTLDVTPLAGGGAQLRFTRPETAAGWLLAEESSDLSTWQPASVAAAVSTAAGAVELQLPPAPAARQRYFRLRVRP